MRGTGIDAKEQKGLNVGNLEDSTAEVFMSEWLGFTISVTKKHKMEERREKKMHQDQDDACGSGFT